MSRPENRIPRCVLSLNESRP